ncbi:uncharacterized protein LOC112456681 [Temnothorax curvispinosus]|uniref:Uncharacterized protein LOC112456681 n=1 Tax=Temnothorax curvispinosus TaxID=300111 RepID=A0A6J1PZ00_9HYME|nr:uncharacterized protein LOC112456681 [Temnothorax curvispinosus]
MRKGHAVQACSSKFTCRLCQRKHHTTLHLDSDSQPKALDVVPTSPLSQPDTTTKEEVNSLFTFSNATARVHVLLATAWITVGSSSGRFVTVRALLDQGSEMTFITEKLAQCLRLKRIRLPTTISAVGCVNAGTYRSAATITISPRDRTAPAFSTTALILKSLTSYIPPRVETELTLSHLADLPWADSDPMSTDPIQILVGADLYGELILDGLRKGATGRPIAQNTVLGWIISGPMASSLVSSHTSSSPLSSTPPFVTSHFCSQGESLEAELRRFWEVEEIPRSSILSPADEQCEEHFRQTHSRCPDGRYMVRLPFKTGPPINIGHSRAIADKCLQRLTRRLQRNPEQQKEYSDFLREYEKLGHMQEVPRSQIDNAQNVYIPHHPVIREDSVTTHLRVVFNASCLTANGSSLNDHLLTGPKLQQDLPAVLLQWRQSRYVYTADITKMYRQIRVDPRDGNYQRILWTPNPSDIPREYVLLTVTYGMISATFLALRVLIQLVTDEGHKFPLAVIILQRKWYADDALFGDDDPIRLRQSRDQLQALLRLGGFELRKWASNSSELLSDIDPANHGLACNKNLQDDERVKVLGISWAPSQDHFQFRVSLDPKLPRTKRTILSTIAKLFDPLGWATPVIVTAKIFMQRLWRLNLNWDDDIPSDDSTRWQSIYTNLEALNRLQIPRWTGYGSDTIRCELHGFADASTSAYAVVVYLKVETLSGRIVISLLTSKSKLAPVKPVTVPRLELLAAVLLARLIQFVRRSIVLKNSDCFCWIDAKIVLAWLSQHPSK